MLGRLPSRRADRLPSEQNSPDPTPDRPPGDGRPGAGGPALDVVAVGNALVDVLASATDEDLVALDLVKGTMALVDQDRSEAIYDTMGPTTEASGGSAANTAAGVAALGGRAAFLGRVADDEPGPGLHPRHPLHRGGLRPHADPGVPGRGRSPATAWCW
jgi:hypothetical protein